ncbi:MAG: CDP-alcohol phosphatidyltransferase family protein [Anaerolineales bacterium]|nr:CDP-alcohol phosphatidyltransferase family protein [Anaerolineales bacterium]
MGLSNAAEKKARVEAIRTLPNFITALRTIACLVIFSIAGTNQDMSLNIVGLAIYWALDCLDGYLARSLGQETIVGAQFDILSDRILVAYFYLNYLFITSGSVLIVSLFLLNFMVLDQYLSNQYLRWSIISPNYFYKIDRTVWALNWSVFGKIFNTAPVTLLLLLTKSVIAPGAILILIFIIKGYSFYRLSKLVPPTVSAFD